MAEPYQTTGAAPSWAAAQAISSLEAPPPEVQELQPIYSSFTSAVAGTTVDSQVSASSCRSLTRRQLGNTSLEAPALAAVDPPRMSVVVLLLVPFPVVMTASQLVSEPCSPDHSLHEMG